MCITYNLREISVNNFIWQTIITMRHIGLDVCHVDHNSVVIRHWRLDNSWFTTQIPSASIR